MATAPPTASDAKGKDPPSSSWSGSAASKLLPASALAKGVTKGLVLVATNDDDSGSFVSHP